MTDEPKKRGRPTSYKPEYAEQAAKLCELGATDVELGDFFGVDRVTIWRWAQQFEDFCNALKVGKEAADERVVRSLYARANGYTFDSVKIFNNNGEPLVVPYREHVPPDTTAAIFWLKNRRRQEWRDRVTHDGDPENPVAVEDVTEARRILRDKITSMSGRRPVTDQQ